MKFMIAIALLITTCSLNAQFHMQAPSPAVIPGGDQEPSGAITLVLADDLLFDQTDETPLYCRIQLSHGAVLAETLVDLEDAQSRSKAIHLAVRYLGDDDRLELTLPADAVSLVRARAEESSLWLRINTPPRTWLNRAGIQSAPNPVDPVAISLGLSAAQSLAQNEDAFPRVWAHLNANVDGNLNPVSTRLLLDLSKVEAKTRAGEEITTRVTWYRGAEGVTTFTDAAAIQPGERAAFSVGSGPVIAHFAAPIQKGLAATASVQGKTAAPQ